MRPFLAQGRQQGCLETSAEPGHLSTFRRYYKSQHALPASGLLQQYLGVGIILEQPF